jgi:hypothetical protein
MRSTQITNAYNRLLSSLGSKEEKNALDRHAPLERPSEAVLISRAIDQAARPEVGTAELRAALELVALDQRHAETREINVVARLRERNVPWSEIAYHRGLRSAQAAKQRYDRMTRSPEVLIYAFRVADESDASWHGDPDALSDGEYQTGVIEFNPAAPRPLSGRPLEVRYGPVDAEVMEPHLRGYTRLNGRSLAATASVQLELFGG